MLERGRWVYCWRSHVGQVNRRASRCGLYLLQVLLLLAWTNYVFWSRFVDEKRSAPLAHCNYVSQLSLGTYSSCGTCLVHIFSTASYLVHTFRMLTFIFVFRQDPSLKARARLSHVQQHGVCMDGKDIAKAKEAQPNSAEVSARAKLLTILSGPCSKN